MGVLVRARWSGQDLNRSARPKELACQARDEPCADRVDHQREHDRLGATHLQQRRYSDGTSCHDDFGAVATNSAACLRISSGLVVAQRMSIRTFLPSTQPN